jgi:hypothetical protein
MGILGNILAATNPPALPSGLICQRISRSVAPGL